MSNISYGYCQQCKFHSGTKNGAWDKPIIIYCGKVQQHIIIGLCGEVDCPSGVVEENHAVEIVGKETEPKEECGNCNAFRKTKHGTRCCSAPQEVVKISTDWCRLWGK